MKKQIDLFPDVADALGIDSVSIVEKDFYIIELLKMIKDAAYHSHQLVFSGGTALSKSGIALNRMSEDVDIKMVPNVQFSSKSREQRKKIRRELIGSIIKKIESLDFFKINLENAIKRDEYRYYEVEIQYPQKHQQAPCLRPFIKLEFIETELLEPPENRNISSLVTQLTDQGDVIESLPCATNESTHVEKLISIMRRTASLNRGYDRLDDKSLVRHIYDNYCIVTHQPPDYQKLSIFMYNCIQQDIARYSNQYPEFCEFPLKELQLGLDRLRDDPIHEQRYLKFALPMVFSKNKITWKNAYATFHTTASILLNILNEKYYN